MGASLFWWEALRRHCRDFRDLLRALEQGSAAQSRCGRYWFDGSWLGKRREGWCLSLINWSSIVQNRGCRSCFHLRLSTGANERSALDAELAFARALAACRAESGSSSGLNRIARRCN